jgi:hypothetical protein
MPVVIKIPLCLLKDFIKLYSLMKSTTDPSAKRVVPLEQLRDLYERIPFARGRQRIALLHRLRGVTTEVRKTRALSGLGSATAMARACAAARGAAADTARR